MRRRAHDGNAVAEAGQRVLGSRAAADISRARPEHAHRSRRVGAARANCTRTGHRQPPRTAPPWMPPGTGRRRRRAHRSPGSALSAVTFPSLVASKAARCVEAAGGRPVAEFGTRRAHTPEAGVLGARAAFWAAAREPATRSPAALRQLRHGHRGAFLGHVFSGEAEEALRQKSRRCSANPPSGSINLQSLLEGARHLKPPAQCGVCSSTSSWRRRVGGSTCSGERNPTIRAIDRAGLRNAPGDRRGAPGTVPVAVASRTKASTRSRLRDGCGGGSVVCLRQSSSGSPATIRWRAAATRRCAAPNHAVRSPRSHRARRREDVALDVTLDQRVRLERLDRCDLLYAPQLLDVEVRDADVTDQSLLLELGECEQPASMSSSGIGQWIWYRAIAVDPEPLEAGVRLAQDRIALAGCGQPGDQAWEQRRLGWTRRGRPRTPASARPNDLLGVTEAVRGAAGMSIQLTPSSTCALDPRRSTAQSWGGKQPNSQPPPPIAQCGGSDASDFEAGLAGFVVLSCVVCMVTLLGWRRGCWLCGCAAASQPPRNRGGRHEDSRARGARRTRAS